jgi:hypothetical protein
MHAKGGFFDLESPLHMFQKLEHDHQRILRAPGDRYSAMDFVLTATHLPNWTGSYHKDSFRPQEICRELANGSKHFRLRYVNIEDTKVVGGGFQFPGFDPAAFDVGHLVIELSGDAAEELGDEISVEALAQRVVDFWRRQLRI